MIVSVASGKNCPAGAFAHLASDRVTCDLDVDAPDLHLLLQPEHQRADEFYSGHQANIGFREMRPLRALYFDVPFRGQECQ